MFVARTSDEGEIRVSPPGLWLRLGEILLQIFWVGWRLVFLDRHDVALGVQEIELAPDRDPAIVLGAIVFIVDRAGYATIEPIHRPRLGEGMIDGRDLVTQGVP